MKSHNIKLIAGIFTGLLMLCNPILSFGQRNLNRPGPANMDTSQFTHVYILRDQPDSFPQYWIGVSIDEKDLYCSKVHSKSIYRVNTKLNGAFTFTVISNGIKEGVELHLIPGKTSYVELKVEPSENGSIKPTLDILDDSLALSRIKAFKGTIIETQSMLPYFENADFIATEYKDTISLMVNQNFIYRFLPLPSWEVMIRFPTTTAFAFINDDISATFEELGGLLHLGPSKCKSQSEFDVFCKSKLKTQMSAGKGYVLSHSYQSPMPPKEGILYATLLSTEEINKNDTSGSGEFLICHSAYIAFAWKDNQGRIVNDCIYTSEYGLQKEVRSVSQLERELLTCWDSFQLIDLKSKGWEIKVVNQEDVKDH